MVGYGPTLNLQTICHLEMCLPDPSPLPGEEIPFPYVFEAFSFTNYIMRPYSRKTLTDENRIFNYRLSRARQVIENTFGILTAR